MHSTRSYSEREEALTVRRSRFFFSGMLVFLLIVTGCSSGGSSDGKKSSTSFDVVDEAYDMIQKNAVYPVQGDELIEGALRGMADTIGDPYSTYLTKEEAAAHRESLASERVGIGAEITRSNGKFVIVAPVKGSPAEKAGLQPYDEIVRIQSERVEGLSLQDVVKKIRGEKGTAVSLTIYRPDSGKHFEVSIIREAMEVQTVSAKIIEERGEKIGYIALTLFGEDTAKEWEQATNELLKNGATGLIIDVRGNPGGYLFAVGNIIGSLVNEDTVFAYMQDAKGMLTPLVAEKSEDFVYDERLKKIPVVLLQDRGSASASEVLAGALNDLQRGAITGTTSFGKGTVQETMHLSNGGEMKLSTNKWLTPKEVWIHGKGIKPQLEVAQNALFTEQIRLVTSTYKEGDYDENIAYAQRVLTHLGFDVGRDDGYFDQATAQAVQQFREYKKMSSNVLMDRQFFAMLKESIEQFRADRKNDEQLQMGIGYLLHQIKSQ